MSLEAAIYNEARKARIAAEASGNNGAIQQYEITRTSRTIKAAFDGVADILLIGGSASGGAAFNGFVGGSGAPGVCIKRVKVAAGQEYVVTIGAGGTAVTRSTAGATPGNVGGSSTLTGPGGLSMIANSGQPGGAKTTKPANGGAGGTASGGDVNSQGGYGGSVIATSCPYAAAGAGACNLKRLDPATEIRGGNINTTALQVTSGGAGVGGNGSSVTGGAAMGVPGGGGYGGPAPDNTSGVGGPNALGELVANSPATFLVPLASQWCLDFFGGGGGTGGGDAGPGGGGCGLEGTTPPAAGIFGGHGGLSYGTTPALKGNVGAGGANAHAATCTSGAGDVGLCVFIIRG